MRRILNQLVAKKRGGKSHQATWNLDDLLFISAVGSEKSDRREITFAHFHQEAGDLPTLRVLGWDGADTVLKIDYVAKTLKEKLLWPQNPKDVQAWRESWAEAFKHKPGHVIRTADALAARLAELARRIRAAAETIMAHESERGVLRKLHKAFQTALIHDLSEADFADTYAQTITYGLLTAAISRTDMSGGEGGTALVAENITDMVPVTNPFLKEMLGTFLHAGGRKRGALRQAQDKGIDFDELGIQDVVELLRSDETDLPAILRDFNNRAEGEDPVIRFYEDFLEAYDKELKVQRGVFYTPKPVVSYIVRGVHELLQSEFGLEDGLAATVTWGEMVARNAEVKIPKGVAANSFFVMILDPATGTATFLVEVIDVIYKTMVAKWKKQGYKDAQIQTAWNEYVPTSLLPRLYGYELMMAPYAIAHMKIGLKLFETGYRFASDQRANIYLTNALEEPSQLAQGSAASLFEALGHESQAVNDVKREVHFTVVIGNPPYSIFSANMTDTAKKLVEKFRFIDGQRIKERGALKAEVIIQDDYVKFLGFVQSLIVTSGVGIIGFITNSNCYLNPVLRGLRYSLSKTFEQIYSLELGGQSKSGNLNDENVFDIDTSVAITLLLKFSATNHLHRHGAIQGSRENKYFDLGTKTVDTLCQYQINPKPDLFLFKHFVSGYDDEYQEYFPVDKIFSITSIGIKTARDHLVMDFDKKDVKIRIDALLDKSNSTSELKKRFDILDNTQWEFSEARKEFQKTYSETHYARVEARPFDTRWLYFHPSVVFNTRPTVNKHVHGKQNLCLLTMRRIRTTTFDHFFVTNKIAMGEILSSADNCYFFPLYSYENFMTAEDYRTPNLLPIFLQSLSKKLGVETREGLPVGITAEDIFHYMYAVFHSPAYRSRYAEFLKIDFPRLPLTSNVALFRQLCGLGKELVGLHLLEDKGLENRGLEISKVKFVKGRKPALSRAEGSNVAKGYPKYEDGKVYVNEEHYFEGVREDVWNFHIGGYQVCAKWLKDRRERELSAEDIVHYGKVVSALGETIRIMAEVDGVIDVNGGWPIG